MQGNPPMHPGQGPGLSEHFLGETGGSETVTLFGSEMATHPHIMRAHNGDQADAQNPSPNASLAQSANGFAYETNTSQRTRPARA
jgi:microcystin-dependent protein